MGSRKIDLFHEEFRDGERTHGEEGKGMKQKRDT